MKKSWFIENDNMGSSLVLKKDAIHWAKYELPSTSHSGGSANDYPINEYYEGSLLYEEVIRFYGLAVAAELLYAVKNKDQDATFIQEEQYTTALQKWLDELPDDGTIDIPWQSKSGQCENTYGNPQGISRIGISFVNTGNTYIVKDTAFGIELCAIKAATSIDFEVIPEKGIRLLCSYAELVLIKAVAGGYRVVFPFKEWTDKWLTNNSEMSGMYVYENNVLVRFKKNRIDSEKDNFLLKVNFDGVLVSKRKV